VRLRRVIVGDLRRNLRHLALASAGIVLGIGTFVFLLSLGEGVKAVMLGEIFPIDRIEVAPNRMKIDLWALRLGVGAETLDEGELERLAAVPGVAAVYPKMELLVPAVMTAGKGFLGVDIVTEVVADGIEPALVSEELGAGFEFRDLEGGRDGTTRSATPCGAGRGCPREMYCSETLGLCRNYVPVVVSRHLVELYNGTMRRSHGFPELNPEVALGLTADLRLGASLFGVSSSHGVIEERLKLVGFSDKAIPVGVTLPLAYVQRYNALFRSAEAAREYHSAIVEVASKADVAGVTARVKQLGFEVSDRGAERAALVLAVLMLVFALVSGAILVVATIHIMHVFSMLVVQREREIGLMRAVGASRGDIRRIILGEAALVGAGAGAVGILIARAAMYGADLLADRWIPPFPYKPETFFHLAPGLAAAAVALAVVSCVIGAAGPAHRAASRDPAEVLRGR